MRVRNQIKNISGEILFIGRGITSSHLPFIIEFSDTFSDNSNIAVWIFEEPIPSQILELKYFQNILSKYCVIVKKQPQIRSPFSINIKVLLSTLFRTLYYTSTFRASKVLKMKSWFSSQISHSILDQCRNRQSDGKLHLSLLSILKASLNSSLCISYAKSLISLGCKYFILGHSTYESRAFLARLRSKESKIFLLSAFCIHRTYSDRDTSAFLFDTPELKNLLHSTLNVDAQQYWTKRCNGFSDYEDSNRALISKNKKSKFDNINLVFLHVFRDSPFYFIDKDRIFVDYVDWIMSTLKILKTSNEKWIIKLHPSANLWGESQSTWIESIIYQVFGCKGLPYNIILSKSDYSNLELIKHAKRVVTFSGSVHCEAACLGIKPVTISTTTLGSLNANLVYKPTSIKEYKNLLLSNEYTFLLPQKSREVALKSLYCLECLLNFRKDVGGSYIYRNESASRIDSELVDILANHHHYSNYFRELGKLLSADIPRSVSMQSLTKFTHLYRNSKYHENSHCF